MQYESVDQYEFQKLNLLKYLNIKYLNNYASRLLRKGNSTAVSLRGPNNDVLSTPFCPRRSVHAVLSHSSPGQKHMTNSTQASQETSFRVVGSGPVPLSLAASCQFIPRHSVIACLSLGSSSHVWFTMSAPAHLTSSLYLGAQKVT